MDKRLFINLQGNRKISGVLRGFDIFLNLVLDEALEENLEGGEKRKMGLVVSTDEFFEVYTVLQAVDFEQLAKLIVPRSWYYLTPGHPGKFCVFN